MKNQFKLDRGHYVAFWQIEVEEEREKREKERERNNTE